MMAERQAEVHPASMEPEELMRECEVSRVRRSGPGGQRRNKVETGVVLCHKPTGLKAQAAERRSQEENRRTALRRLRLHLAVQVRRVRRASAVPSSLWQRRCRHGAISVNPRHADYPALLAEALDVTFEANADVKSAAAQLQCTTSQFVKFLKTEPGVWKRVNERRREHGLRPLK